MILWLDAQISPRLCLWIGRRLRMHAVPVRDLGLRQAEDPEIFDRARKAQAVVFTKDEDFVDLVRRLGTPPQVLWLRCGNMPRSSAPAGAAAPAGGSELCPPGPARPIRHSRSG